MPPEARLLFMLCGSGFMYHMSNSFFRSKMPDMGDILKKNPELAKNQLIFPDQATLDKLYSYPSLSAADERELTAQMQKVTGA